MRNWTSPSPNLGVSSPTHNKSLKSSVSYLNVDLLDLNLGVSNSWYFGSANDIAARGNVRFLRLAGLVEKFSSEPMEQQRPISLITSNMPDSEEILNERASLTIGWIGTFSHGKGEKTDFMGEFGLIGDLAGGLRGKYVIFRELD